VWVLLDKRPVYFLSSSRGGESRCYKVAQISNCLKISKLRYIPKSGPADNDSKDL
jgi:hypothetical protein